jgi:hypothetical protein
METGAQLAERIMAEIEAEVAEVEDRTRELKKQLPELTKAKDDAWDEYAGPAANKDKGDEAAGQKYEQAFTREMGVMDAIKRNGLRISTLRSPDEFDRRMTEAINKKGGIKRMTEEATKERTKKPTARDRGVPEIYLNAETGNFKVGADARYKSDLVSSALGIPDESRLQDFEPKDAEKRLAERDWTPFLERKREILAEKERKAAERAKEKEQAAREKAAAKEQAKQDAAAAKAAGQAAPDPKPGSKGKSK